MRKITAVLLLLAVWSTLSGQNWPPMKIGRFQSVSTNGTWNSTLFNVAAGTGGTLSNGNYLFQWGAGIGTSDTTAAMVVSDTMGNKMSMRLQLSDMCVGMNYLRGSDSKNNTLRIYSDSMLFKMSDVKVGMFDNAGDFTFYKNIVVNEDIKSDVNKNSRLGTNAGSGLTSGTYNTYLGYQAGYNNTTGSYNVAIGQGSGTAVNSGNNVLIGSYAGENYNSNLSVFIGSNAGQYSSSTKSVYLGYASGKNSTGINNIFIGPQAGQDETGSNKLFIDNSATASPLVYGNFADDSLKINGTFQSMGNTIIGGTASSTTKINGDTIYIWGDILTGQIEFTDYVGNIGNATTPNDTVFFDCQSDGLFMDCLFSVELDSAENYSFPDTNTVYFTINVYDGDELVEGIVEKDGTVNIYASYGTITWDDADTSGDYCVYDGGTHAILTNNTATTKTFVGRIRYKRP